MTHSERDRVRELLGREPRGQYEVVVRSAVGDPIVIRNDPLLDDGTPMPTRYWLVGAEEIRRIGRLESTGGVDAAEAAVGADEIAAAHARYAAERDASIPADHDGPRPSGGVGGTRLGVKCLHAHWAWHLAGGDDPVGRWIADQFDSERDDGRCTVEVGAEHTVVRRGSVRHEIPWGVDNLTARWFTDDDPPRPDALTNALGTVTDHLDDLVRLHAHLIDVDDWRFAGAAIAALAALETGGPIDDTDLEFSRPTAEEVFRLVVMESRADRAHNPGLPSDSVDSIVATCCILQAFMRRLHLESVTLHVD